MTKQGIMDYLREHFGITTERELNAAMSKIAPLHIGIMTSKKETNEDDNIAGLQRVGV